MNRNNQQASPYHAFPFNLLLAIKGRSKVILPTSLTQDIYSGIEYALSTLDEKENALLHQRYYSGKSQRETAICLNLSTEEIELLEAKALKKLRHPSIWNFIQHGVVGYIKIRVTAEYNRGYTLGYSAGYKNCTVDYQTDLINCHSPDNIPNLPIENMHLTQRTYHCLQNAGCYYIRDIAILPEEKIARIRGLGAISANEVARTLQKYGITCTAWNNYL